MEIFLLGLITAFFGTFVTTSAKLIATRFFEENKKTTHSSDNVIMVVFVILQ